MLYELWQRTAREHRHELALLDLATGERWTFEELAGRPARSAGLTGALLCPRGNRAAFILDLLDAWRGHGVVCPLEPNQPMPVVPPTPAGIVHLKTTSATTQKPRLVAFTAAQLAADASHIVSTMGLRPDWPNLGVISLAHSYGFSNLVLPLLLHGIPLILLESPLPEALRRAASVVQDFTVAAVPALWRAWHEAGVIVPHIRLAISAGAPLSLPLEAAVFQNSGLKLHNFYGASECGGIAYDASTRPRTDPSCLGQPLQQVQVSMNAESCLEVRSAAVGKTYWPEPEPGLGAGVYRTSDLGEIRAGLIHLRGRAGDLINVAGRKLSPETVEKELQLHPGIKECLVFGAAAVEAERTEVVVACVSAKEGVDAESLRRFLLDRLPAWQVPREWKFVESLTVNQRGKLSRTEWRRRLGFSQPGHPVTEG